MVRGNLQEYLAQLCHSFRISKILDRRLRSWRVDSVNQQDAAVAGFVGQHEDKHVIACQLIGDGVEFRLVDLLLSRLRVAVEGKCKSKHMVDTLNPSAT